MKEYFETGRTCCVCDHRDPEVETMVSLEGDAHLWCLGRDEQEDEIAARAEKWRRDYGIENKEAS